MNNTASTILYRVGWKTLDGSRSGNGGQVSLATARAAVKGFNASRADSMLHWIEESTDDGEHWGLSAISLVPSSRQEIADMQIEQAKIADMCRIDETLRGLISRGFVPSKVPVE